MKEMVSDPYVNKVNRGTNKWQICRRFLKRPLFIVIRVFLWLITFLACIPAPWEWLDGVVIESGVDLELCLYYFKGDAIMLGIYILNLFVWTLPFVPIRKMWYALRVDILSLCTAILTLTCSYLAYVEWFV